MAHNTLLHFSKLKINIKNKYQLKRKDLVKQFCLPLKSASIIIPVRCRYTRSERAKQNCQATTIL